MKLDTVKSKSSIEKIASDIGIDLNTTIDLLKMLLSQTRLTNAELNQAVELGSYKDIISFAHDIKGSCGNFRLMDIYETSATIERMGRNSEDTKEMSKLCSEIDGMLDWYVEEVRTYQ